MIEIQEVCIACGVKHFAAVTAEGYRRYIEGGMVQDCFPNMSADYRELFFMSGLCPSCWDSLIPEDNYDLADFGYDDEEDEDF